MKAAVSQELTDLYEGKYYGDDPGLFLQRKLAASNSVNHIQAVHPHGLGKTVDVGSGNGSVINELVDRGLISDITALEISASGIEQLKQRQLDAVTEIVKFDGYTIPFPDRHFDTAICIHVLEHVEHERLLLREMGRVAKDIFIEIPLEGGFRGRLNYKFGHINYYNPLSARAILETSGLKIISEKVVTSCLALEQHTHGKRGGALRFALRRFLLSTIGRRAPDVMTFLYMAHCRAQ